MEIKKIKHEDIEEVLRIYHQGILTGCATFQTEVPSADEWDKAHLQFGRLKAVDHTGRMLGWVALSPTSSRCVYKGVVELSIYVAEEARRTGVGEELIQAVIKESERNGIWTLQSAILEINRASIALHKKCKFREIGYRERVAKDCDGIWRNVVLMEKRSQSTEFQ